MDREYRFTHVAEDKLGKSGLDLTHRLGKTPWEIEGLVCIGGDGSFHGAHYLEQEHGIRCIGVPGTIDNDLFGVDISVGVDTALNVALEAIDRLRATGSSLERAFLVEVMGRNCGYLALAAGF